MSLIFRALTAEPWAIVPANLELIARIAQRHHNAVDPSKGEPEYQRRDYLQMAGPGAQPIPGAQRAYAIDGVAVIPVIGPIFPRANMMTAYSGATSVTMLQNDFKVALDNSAIGAIMLMIDSPGGAVSGIKAFADQVAAGSKKKRTVAYVSGAACSAAYWIATAASEISMDPTAMVGSIGVVAAIPVQVAPDSNGEMWIEVVSTNAPNKRPDPTSEDGRAEVVTMLDDLEHMFVADVARGRKVSTETVLAEFGKGGVKIGSKAVKAGMADRVRSYDAELADMRRQVANERKLNQLKQ